jgi:hypothetical protein
LIGSPLTYEYRFQLPGSRVPLPDLYVSGDMNLPSTLL